MNTYQITVVNDPADISAREIYDTKSGTNLLDWLIDIYGPDGLEIPTSIYKGSISELTLIDINDYSSVNIPINDSIFVVRQPLGTDPFTLFILPLLAVAALIPVPKIADLSGGAQSKKSPNNALSGQSNIARALDRVPDIFGKVRSYPDLIAPTVTEFVNHIKFQKEYMCVGRGFYLLEEFKSGDTLISDVPGSTTTTFDPGSAPTEVLKTRQSNEVAGQELIGPNEEAAVGPTQDFTVTYAIGTDKATISWPGGTNVWEGFNNGDTVNISELWANDGTTDLQLDGTYIIDAPTSTDLVLRDAAVENANWTNFDAITKPVLLITGSMLLQPLISIPDQVVEIGPFVVPGNNNDEIWVDLQAPKGLAQGERLNNTREVSIKFTFEQIDDFDVPTGSSFTKTFVLSEKTRDPRFWTFKLTSTDGLLVGTRYRAKGERLTDSNPTAIDIVEEIRWTRLVGIENITEADTTGTTRVVIDTQATEQVASIQDRKFNVEATRKTVTWDGVSVVGDIDTGVGLVASRRMADSFLHYMLDPKLAARTISALDVDAIFAIQDKLDLVFSGEKGEFSFTFDGKDTPALEELRQIAQAARCFAFREGSIFSMTRDEDQLIDRGLFNRRNKLPDKETKSIRFNRPLDNDGITLEYTDIEDNNARTITFPDDLPTSDPNFGLPNAINPLKVDGMGIRQYTQAWDRAQYEFRKQIYNRVKIETSVSADGILLPLNARIQHVDGTRLTVLESDGEIKAINGLIITTSQKTIFEEGKIYSVILRDEVGDASTPIIVTERLDTEFGFVLSALPSFDIVVRGDNDYQRGTLYSFAPDGNELSNAYLVQRKTPDKDGNVRLELINYSAEYYAADNTTPPAKAPL